MQMVAAAMKAAQEETGRRLKRETQSGVNFMEPKEVCVSFMFAQSAGFGAKVEIGALFSRGIIDFNYMKTIGKYRSAPPCGNPLSLRYLA
jgi:hypothetical protein